MPVINSLSIDEPEVFPGVFSRQVLNKEHGEAQSITIGELNINPEAVLPAHIHNVEESLIIVEGRGLVYLGDESFEIKPGLFVLIPSNTKHKVVNTGPEKLKILYMFPAVDVERTLV